MYKNKVRNVYLQDLYNHSIHSIMCIVKDLFSSFFSPHFGSHVSKPHLLSLSLVTRGQGHPKATLQNLHILPYACTYTRHIHFPLIQTQVIHVNRILVFVILFCVVSLRHSTRCILDHDRFETS